MKETIYKRKSVRKYNLQPMERAVLDELKAKMDELKPLYPQIRVKGLILNQEDVRFYFPWRAPHLIAVFSENKPGYLENVGFLYQQMDLYLQSRGIGACWMGLGKVREKQLLEQLKNDGMEFVILLAFGYPEDNGLRSDVSQFKRKAMEEISDQEDSRLECARLAPSSTNSQPWYFTHENGQLHAFCTNAGLLRHAMLGVMNKIDMGIALAHLYTENADTFRFETRTPPPCLDGFNYIGTVTI